MLTDEDVREIEKTLISEITGSTGSYGGEGGAQVSNEVGGEKELNYNEIDGNGNANSKFSFMGALKPLLDNFKRRNGQVNPAANYQMITNPYNTDAVTILLERGQRRTIDANEIVKNKPQSPQGPMIYSPMGMMELGNSLFTGNNDNEEQFQGDSKYNDGIDMKYVNNNKGYGMNKDYEMNKGVNYDVNNNNNNYNNIKDNYNDNNKNNYPSPNNNNDNQNIHYEIELKKPIVDAIHQLIPPEQLVDLAQLITADYGDRLAILAEESKLRPNITKLRPSNITTILR